MRKLTNAGEKLEKLTKAIEIPFFQLILDIALVIVDAGSEINAVRGRSLSIGLKRVSQISKNLRRYQFNRQSETHSNYR